MPHAKVPRVSSDEIIESTRLSAPEVPSANHSDESDHVHSLSWHDFYRVFLWRPLRAYFGSNVARPFPILRSLERFAPWAAATRSIAKHLTTSSTAG